MKIIASTLFGLLLAVTAGASLAGPTMDVTGAWIREAPPTARVLAAYMQVTNLTGEELTITDVSSPDFAAAQLHRTVIEDGIAKMLPVSQLAVPAASSITLEPGGLHLMLHDPLRPLSQGDSVTLILHRSDEICVTLSVPVLRGTEEEHVHHHH